MPIPSISNEGLPAECIDQAARVVHQEGNEVEVVFTANSACSQCNAKGACFAFESTDKTARIKTLDQFRPGDEVVISLQRGLGGRAVLLGFIIPFLLIIVVLFTTFAFTHRQGISALAGLASLLPYFWVLHLKRAKLEQRFRLTIKKTD